MLLISYSYLHIFQVSRHGFKSVASLSHSDPSVPEKAGRVSCWKYTCCQYVILFRDRRIGYWLRWHPEASEDDNDVKEFGDDKYNEKSDNHGNNDYAWWLNWSIKSVLATVLVHFGNKNSFWPRRSTSGGVCVEKQPAYSSGTFVRRSWMLILYGA